MTAAIEANSWFIKAGSRIGFHDVQYMSPLCDPYQSLKYIFFKCFLLFRITSFTTGITVIESGNSFM